MEEEDGEDYLDVHDEGVGTGTGAWGMASEYKGRYMQCVWMQGRIKQLGRQPLPPLSLTR